MHRTVRTPGLHPPGSNSPEQTACPALLRVLRDHAHVQPDAPAIVVDHEDREISYAALCEAVERLARQLRGAGVGTGDVVIAQVENDWTVLALLLASSLNGSVFVPLSMDIQPGTLRHIQRETHPKLALYSCEKAPKGVFGTIALPVRELLASEPDTARAPLKHEASTEPLLIIYTSGTTGVPKGVVLSESNLVTMAAGIGGTYAISPRDRMLCVMPLYHMNGLMITGLVPLIAGAATVLAERFRFQAARTYLQKVATRGITVLSVIPSIMAVLTRISAPVDLSAAGVRLTLCGAAPLPAPLWRQFEEHFGVPVHQGYGLTETTCWATMTRPGYPPNYDGVGMPLNCEVRIDGTADEPGEVMIRGPIVLIRYQSRKSPLENGWFRTGDIGYFDEDGCLVISGRIKDTIIRYGINVHPSEIDRVLVRFPGIAESATVGLPDSIAGETVHTACIARPGAAALDPKALRDFLAQHVAASALPDRLHAMRALPTNAIGKTDRKRLRELLSGEAASRIVDGLNTKKWLRYKLDDTTRLTAALQSAITQYAPVPMLTYWGAGRKAGMDDIDRAALDRLRDMIGDIQALYEPGVDLTVLFTDVHYRINGLAADRTDAYVAEIAGYCARHGFRTARGSDIWNEAGLSLEAVAIRANSEEGRAEWASLDMREELVSQAARHCASTDADAEQGARIYYNANLLEKDVFAERFAGHIFLTYNRSTQAGILPNLPLLFIHSHRQYASEKPWFVASANQEAGTDSAT